MHRRARQTFTLLPLAPLLLICGGCKLLFIPRVETFPDPLREVRVVDLATGQAVAGAKVDLYVLPFRSPERSPAEHSAFQLASGEPDAPPSPSDRDMVPGSFGHLRPDTHTPPGRVTRPRVTELGPGRYRLARHTSLAWSQFLWPFRHPGDRYWKNYGGYTAVVVHAPGYRWLNLSFGPGKSPAALRQHLAAQGGTAQSYMRLTPLAGRCDVADDGVATFFLEPLR